MMFLRILFFSRVVLLTPMPINLFGEVELNPQEPLTAITRGACIQINVSSIITKSKQIGVLEFERRMEELFPAGSIEAILIGKDTRPLTLFYDGNFAYSKNEVFLTLHADGGVPTDVEFDRIIITSNIELKSVLVSWKNYKL